MIEFSVIIPAHHSEATLGEALESVAGQRYAAHEVVVVVDRSPDGSAGLARSLGEELGLSMTVRETGHGNAAAARNEGAALASGGWLAFLDADDRWRADHLERAAEQLAVGGCVGRLNRSRHMVTGEGGLVPRVGAGGDGAGESLTIDPYGEGLRHGLTMNEFMGAWVPRRWFAGMSSCIIASERFREVGGFDPAFRRRHDIELWFRVLAGKRCVFDPEPTTDYRVDTPGSLSKAMAEREELLLRALEKNRSLFEPGHARAALLRSAQRVLATALAGGDAGSRRAAWLLASPHLAGVRRVLWRLGMVFPGVFAAVYRRRLARQTG